MPRPVVAYNAGTASYIGRRKMRAATMGFLAVFALAALSTAANAAPVAPLQLAGPPAVTLARGGCGPGWHPQTWRDRWGNWHRRCVPNRW